LSRAAQAPLPCFPDRSRFARAALLAACPILSACGAGGFSMRHAEVDPTILTGDISAPAARNADADRLSDQATIRNAVSSADLELVSGEAVRWANAQTGARGSITGLTESRSEGRICRGFATTRENYDGVRLFRGEACMLSAGVWRIEKFEAL
jgi:hypothetical protein